MRMRGGMDVPSDITTVFFKLMVILKSLQALAKRSHKFYKCISEWATRVASSAYSNYAVDKSKETGSSQCCCTASQCPQSETRCLKYARYLAGRNKLAGGPDAARGL